MAGSLLAVIPPTVRAAKKALAALERDIASAKTGLLAALIVRHAAIEAKRTGREAKVLAEEYRTLADACLSDAIAEMLDSPDQPPVTAMPYQTKRTESDERKLS